MANFLRSPFNTAVSSRSSWVLVVTILGSSMAFIDGTIVNLALPALQSILHASISQIQWVIEAYALTLGALLLVGGALGDFFGRRKIFLIGIVIFAVSSAWCGIASTILTLIAARTIQGIGAALLVPGSLALISASFPEERGQAIGTWAGFSAIITAAGPVVGGWLIQHTSWRWIFFLNLPLAMAVFIISIFYVSESKNEHHPPVLDFVGAFFAIIGLGAIVFGLIEWEYGAKAIFVALMGLIAMIGFVFIEAKAPFPMVPLSMFRSRNFSGANLITFFLYSALYGVLFFFPLNLIQILGYTPTQAGLAILPLILQIFLLSRWAGTLVKRFGPKRPLIVGPAIASVGFALFLRVNLIESYWVTVFPATVILGLGMAISIAPLTTVVMNSVSLDHAGAASGVNNAVSRIAGLLAVAILGFIMTMIFNHQLVKNFKASRTPLNIQQGVLEQQSQLAAIKTNDAGAHQIIENAFVTGYKIIILIASLLALVSSMTAVIMIERES